MQKWPFIVLILWLAHYFAFLKSTTGFLSEPNCSLLVKVNLTRNHRVHAARGCALTASEFQLQDSLHLFVTVWGWGEWVLMNNSRNLQTNWRGRRSRLIEGVRELLFVWKSEWHSKQQFNNYHYQILLWFKLEVTFTGQGVVCCSPSFYLRTSCVCEIFP